MIEILTLDTPSLGDRSYLVSDGAVAVVIDPQRDIDRVLGLAEEVGVRITHVAETHIHNDYVSGGLALARRVGAEYLVAADDEVAFERRPVRDGDVIAAGQVRLRVMHTPGHTFTHHAYVFEDVDRRVHGVFTGGSLLFGSTGRPDLLGAQHTETLARHQFASAHRLAARVRQLLLGHPGARVVLDRRRGVPAQSGSHRGRGHLRRRAARGVHDPPGVLRPHGASGPASGWSTCGVGRRTRRATCRGRSTSASTAAS